MTPPVTRPLEHIWLGSVDYQVAWNLQRQLAVERAADRIPDTLLCLEHPPVYTLGRNTEPAHLGAGPEALRALGAECLEVDRGGSVTFHGPGQLVAYPILRLADHFPVANSPTMGDVVAYVRALEAALIGTAATAGVSAQRRPGFTGAWVGNDKLAAIGVKLASGVTQHGVAFNVAMDLGWFRQVTPCGISEGGVTSLAQLGSARTSPESLAPVLAEMLATQLRSAATPAGARLRGLCLRPELV